MKNEILLDNTKKYSLINSKAFKVSNQVPTYSKKLSETFFISKDEKSQEKSKEIKEAEKVNFIV